MTRPRPSAGTLVGAALVVVGVVAIGFSLIRSGDETAATVTTTVSASPQTTTTTELTGAHGGTTAPLGGHDVGEGVAPVVRGRHPLRGFGEVRATITAADGSTCEVCLMAAFDEAQRQRGLMEVTDPELGGYDGMLFIFPAETKGAFWMRNTPLPLSIAYFDGDRRFVSAVDMAPCGNTPQCESYPAADAFEYTLEVPKGGFEALGVGEGATFEIDGWTCPLAKTAS